MANVRAPGKRTVTRTLGQSVAVLASVLVAGQFASSAHLLLVPHTVCPVHGELVHVEPGNEHHHAGLAGGGRFAAIGSVETPEAHHGHEHCVLVSNRRSLVALRPAAEGSLAPPRLSAALEWLEDVSPGARVALLRLAPKQSPPA